MRGAGGGGRPARRGRVAGTSGATIRHSPPAGMARGWRPDPINKPIFKDTLRKCAVQVADDQVTGNTSSIFDGDLRPWP